MGWNRCRRHVKVKEATSNTKIVANMPSAAAAAAAAATSTFTATVITANIIDQTFTIFFGRREPPLLVFFGSGCNDSGDCGIAGFGVMVVRVMTTVI